MKKALFCLVVLMFFINICSAEIIINQQPKEVYNLGNSVSVSTTIKAISGVTKVFQMDLLCQDRAAPINFYKNGISLSSGEEKTIEASLILVKEFIGETLGRCKIKASLGQDYLLTDEFEISDSINIQSKLDTLEFSPGENIVLSGSAYKKNGEDVSGFIEIKIVSPFDEADNIVKLSTINHGLFSANITLPSNLKAGTYLVSLYAYEQDENTLITNKGNFNYNILIKQVPTTLEIVFEKREIFPNESVKVKTIVHDQTGEKIPFTSSIITIKKQNNEIILQTEKPTEEFLEYSIDYKEPPSEWKVVAVSNKLMSEDSFKILENKQLEVVIINRTLQIKNIGNVPYTDSAIINIGNESFKINLSLGIDGVQKFELTAPNGEYPFEFLSDGKKHLSTNVVLTGRTVDIREISEGGFKSIIRHYPLVFIFLILVLFFFALIAWKKGIRNLFFGKFKKKAIKQNLAWENREIPKEGRLINSQNIAQLSLSIKGEKHPASIVCLRIKNLKEIDTKDNGIKEIFQKIANFVDDKKAFTYENQENIMFVLSPSKTKTFQNELHALEIAKKINEALSYQNQIFKQKIDFGISIHSGNIVSKSESKNLLSFMGLENTLMITKKLASLSSGEILLSKEAKEKLKEYIKPEEHRHEGLIYYKFSQMKNNVENAKFLSNFIKRNNFSKSGL